MKTTTMKTTTNPLYKTFETPSSTAIEYVGYNPTEKLLTIAFKRKGDVAAYGYKVGRDVFLTLRNVHAKGGSVGKA